MSWELYTTKISCINWDCWYYSTHQMWTSRGSLSLWCHFKGVDIYCQCFSTQFYYNACFDLFCSCDHGTHQQSDGRDPSDESPSPSASRPCSPNLKHYFLLALHPVMRRKQSVSKRISHNAWRGPCPTPA